MAPIFDRIECVALLLPFVTIIEKIDSILRIALIVIFYAYSLRAIVPRIILYV